MPDVLPIIIVIISLSGLVGGVTLLKKAGKIGPEMARKAVHMVMGVICMTFPWVFSSPLPVQILGVVSALGIFVLKSTSLKDKLGAALFSVERVSGGEILFPLAVAWLFTLAYETPVLYIIPLLLLTFGDAFGALVGTRYGKRHYQTLSGKKSIEGSFTFFVISFLCTFLPLFFFYEFTWIYLLLISLVVSLIATLLEGGASHGMDNMFIPMASFLVLDYYLAQSEMDLLFRLLALGGLMGVLIGTRHMHTFDGAGGIGCILFGFGAFTMGGVLCLLSACVLFSRHLYVSHKFQLKGSVLHTLAVIFWVGVVPTLWLTLGRIGQITYEGAQQGAILSLASIGLMVSVGTIVYMKLSSKHFIKSVMLYFGIAFPLYCARGLQSAHLVAFAFALLAGVMIYFIRCRASGHTYWSSIASLAFAQSLLSV